MLERWAQLQEAAPPRTPARKAAAAEYTAVFESILLHARVLVEFLGVGTDRRCHVVADFPGAPTTLKDDYQLGQIYGQLNSDLAHLSKDRQMRCWAPLADLGEPILDAFNKFTSQITDPPPDIVDGNAEARARLGNALSILSRLPDDRARHDPFHMPS